LFPGKGERSFYIPQLLGEVWVPPSLLSDGYRGALSPEVKRPELEVDHSPLFIVEVKSGGAILLFSQTPSWHDA
jgi:hypothetical protein